MQALGLRDAKDLIDGMITEMENHPTYTDTYHDAQMMRGNKIQFIKALREASKKLELTELETELQRTMTDPQVQRYMELRRKIDNLIP